MKRISHTLTSLLLSIFTLTSCLQGEEATKEAQTNFHSLWNAIDQHYCFLDYKKQELGVDWDEIYGRYQQKIDDNMKSVQLFEVLCAMLSELKDGHVNLHSSIDYGRNWSWKEDFPKNLDEEVREKYLGTGNDYKITSGLKYRILPENVGYIVCESFSMNFSETALSEVLYYLRSCNGLILDVRGNSGGNLTSAEALSARFTNERRLVGYFCHKTGPGHNDFSEPVEEYIEPSKGVRWQKACILLTNRSCYSSTNAFVRNMKQCPNVTILGDQTGGGSGMPFTSELPNGWTIRFSACPMFDANKQHIEFGIQPDIPCELTDEDVARGKDTMIEKAINLINKQQ